MFKNMDTINDEMEVEVEPLSSEISLDTVCYNELEEKVVPLPLVEEISVDTKINDEFDDETSQFTHFSQRYFYCTLI